jgi:hypothetical protein
VHSAPQVLAATLPRVRSASVPSSTSPLRSSAPSSAQQVHADASGTRDAQSVHIHGQTESSPALAFAKARVISVRRGSTDLGKEKAGAQREKAGAPSRGLGSANRARDRVRGRSRTTRSGRKGMSTMRPSERAALRAKSAESMTEARCLRNPPGRSVRREMKSKGWAETRRARRNGRAAFSGGPSRTPEVPSVWSSKREAARPQAKRSYPRQNLV